MTIEKCNSKPKFLMEVEGIGTVQLCRKHMNDKHIQHLVKRGVIVELEVEDLQGKCDGVIHKRTAGKGVPQGEVVE